MSKLTLVDLSVTEVVALLKHRGMDRFSEIVRKRQFNGLMLASLTIENMTKLDASIDSCDAEVWFNSIKHWEKKLPATFLASFQSPEKSAGRNKDSSVQKRTSSTKIDYHTNIQLELNAMKSYGKKQWGKATSVTFCGQGWDIPDVESLQQIVAECHKRNGFTDSLWIKKSYPCDHVPNLLDLHSIVNVNKEKVLNGYWVEDSTLSWSTPVRYQ